MKKGINKVILVGNLGQAPELRYSAKGSGIATLSVATSEYWKQKDTGQTQEKTEWHRVVIFGKLAEIAGEYLVKGAQVYIEGKLQTRKWQDKQGQDKYSTEVVVDGYDGVMQMLGNRTKDSSLTTDKTGKQADESNSFKPADPGEFDDTLDDGYPF